MEEFLNNLDKNKPEKPTPPQEPNTPTTDIKPDAQAPNPSAGKTKPPAGPKPQEPAKPKPKTDLTVIKGIAEKTQEVLNKGDVKTIDQMAKMSPTEIKLALQKGAGIRLTKCKTTALGFNSRKQSLETPRRSSRPRRRSQPPNPLNQTPQKPRLPIFPSVLICPKSKIQPRKKLADLVIKRQYLLGVEIICEEGVARGKPVFELERSKDDKQKWNVTVRKSAKQRPLPIATFRKSENAFLFQWLPEASTDKTAAKLASNLRNCLLKLKLPEDQGTIVFLRTPMIDSRSSPRQRIIFK